MSKPSLREALQREAFILAPGVHDMITALLARQVGFDFIYASGYWLTASAYGMPDAGLVTLTQMLDRLRHLIAVSEAGVIADADTGFGGLVNVRQTVREYEAAGVAAIQIEDQVFPKRCGHTGNKRLAPLAECVNRIRVASDARRDADGMLVIARTDAIAVEGYDAALARLEAYADAGADILFLESPTSVEQMRDACARFDLPMLANMADGGNTPIMDQAALADIGYRLAIFPATTALAAAAAIEQALLNLKHQGTSLNPALPLYDFKTFCSLVGFDEINDFVATYETPSG